MRRIGNPSSSYYLAPAPHVSLTNRGRAQHRKQVPFVTALYRAPRHLRLRLRHHPRLLQIASVANFKAF